MAIMAPILIGINLMSDTVIEIFAPVLMVPI
jgi:hypothetical protein